MPGDTDRVHMRRALRLAARGAGRNSPDPLVGAVVVRDGDVAGEAFQQRPGEAHAEAAAIARAAERAGGATLYTTLEPCAACAGAIASAGIARVVAAMRGPDPRVDGRGVRDLRAAGIVVETGLLEDEARRLNAGFVSRVTRGRPIVLLALATTLDGRIVAGRRPPKPVAKELHRLRDRYDAVLVDAAAVVADDPELGVREVKGRDPLRVVLDADARTPATAKVVRGGDPQRTIVFVARDADQRRAKRLRDVGVLVATLPRSGDGLDAGAGLRWLAEHGVSSVLCEGGPALVATLLRERLVDRLLLYLAPTLAGGGSIAVEGLPAPIDVTRLRARKLGAEVALEADL